MSSPVPASQSPQVVSESEFALLIASRSVQTPSVTTESEIPFTVIVADLAVKLDTKRTANVRMTSRRAGLPRVPVSTD